MNKTVLIRPRPEKGPNQVAVYYLQDKEEKIDEGPGVSGLKEYIRGRLKKEVDAGNRNVILDLASVEWIDSMYVGMILSWRQLVHERDGHFVLVNLSKRSQGVLKVARLDDVLNVRDSLSDAQRYISDTTP